MFFSFLGFLQYIFVSCNCCCIDFLIICFSKLSVFFFFFFLFFSPAQMLKSLMKEVYLILLFVWLEDLMRYIIPSFWNLETMQILLQAVVLLLIIWIISFLCPPSLTGFLIQQLVANCLFMVQGGLPNQLQSSMLILSLLQINLLSLSLRLRIIISFANWLHLSSNG